MSSNDLIADYFRRDLGEDEDEALARLLQASPEAAERFAAQAAAEYKAFGLPEPTEGGGGRGLRWALLLIALGGAAAYFWPAAPEARSVLAVAEADDSFAVVRRQAPPPAAVEAPAPAAPAAEPARLLVSAQTPRGPFDIRIVGARAGSGSVHNAQGAQVAELQRLDGRSFRWDGRAAGRTAPAGAYQIRLDAGGEALKQWVEIEVR